MSEEIGDTLPPFANDEVRLKFNALKEKERAADAAEVKALELTERIKQISEHFKNVSAEFDSGQEIANLRQQELVRRDHEKAVKAGEISRIKLDISQTDSRKQQAEDLIISSQTAINNTFENMHNLKATLNWTEEELQQWVKASKSKLDDEAALDKYRKSDDARIKDLRRKLEVASESKAKKTEALANVISETKTLQLELDGVSDQLKEAAAARASDLAEWERTLQLTSDRDKQIVELEAEYVKALGRFKDKEQKVNHLAKFAEMLSRENSSKLAEVSISDKKIGDLRFKAIAFRAELTEFIENVESAKNEVLAAASDQSRRRQQLISLRQTTEAKKKRVLELQTRLSVDEARLEDLKNGKQSKEQEAAAAVRTIEELYRRVGEKEKAKRAAVAALTTAQTELAKDRVEESGLILEISSILSALKNVKSVTGKLDEEKRKQREVVYSLDFDTQVIHRNMARLNGERTIEEKRDLTSQASQLETELEEHRKTLNLVTNQVKRQQNDINAARRSLAAAVKEQERLADIVKELDVQAEVTTREETTARNQLSEKSIIKDNQKLDGKRAKEALAKTIEAVFAAESKLQQLLLEAQEREQHMETERDMLRAELRKYNDEKHALVMRHAEAATKLKVLQGRYDTLVKSRGPSDGGEQKSQAYYILKAAQHKAELQRRGEELNLQLQHGEKELRALENSLAHLQNSNRQYTAVLKKSLKASKAGIAMEDIRSAEDEIKMLNDTLHVKTKQLADLERVDFSRDIEEAQKKVETLTLSYEQLQTMSRAMAGDVTVNSGKFGRVRSLQVPGAVAQLSALQSAKDALVELSRTNASLESFVRDNLN